MCLLMYNKYEYILNIKFRTFYYFTITVFMEVTRTKLEKTMTCQKYSFDPRAPVLSTSSRTDVKLLHSKKKIPCMLKQI